MKRYLSVFVTTLAMLGVLLVVDSLSDSATASGAKTATITISNFTYGGNLTVHPGVRVIVRNNDSVAHTATNPGSRFNTGTIAPHTSKSFIAPSTVGNFNIRCNFHSTMGATLHVRR